MTSATGHSPTVAALQAFAVDVSSALDTIETCTSDEELATLSRLVGEALAAGLAPFFIVCGVRIRCNEYNAATGFRPRQSTSQCQSDGDPKLSAIDLVAQIEDRVGAAWATGATQASFAVDDALLRFFWFPLLRGKFEDRVMATHAVAMAGNIMLKKVFLPLYDEHVAPLLATEPAEVTAAAGIVTGASMPAWKRALIEKKKSAPRVGPPQPAPNSAEPAAPPPPSPLDGAHTIPVAGPIDWVSTTAVRSFAGGLGSSGVFVIVLGDGGAVVLKPASASSLPAELFGTRLMRFVGLAAPDGRVPAAADHISIGRAVRDPKLHKNPEDQEVLFQRYRKGNKLWLLSEFARGKAAFALTPAAVDVPSTLRQLGKICTIDAVLNNWDRLPAAHANSGNITNWLIGEDGTVVPIDQCVSRITAPTGQALHVDRIRALAAEARGGAPGACCKRVHGHLLECAGWDLPLAGFAAFLDGVGEMVEILLASVTRTDMAKLKHSIREEFLKGGAVPSLLSPQMDGIDLDFIIVCIDALRGPGPQPEPAPAPVAAGQ